MSKTFKELKKGDTIFLVGSPDLIVHEDLVEGFGIFVIKNIIETLDGKRNPLICISGNYNSVPEIDKGKVAYFTALSENEICGHIASVRLDEWSEVFTKTVSSQHTFLCFPDVASGLDFLETRLKKYLEDIKESREINNKTLEARN